MVPHLTRNPYYHAESFLCGSRTSISILNSTIFVQSLLLPNTLYVDWTYTDLGLVKILKLAIRVSHVQFGNVYLEAVRYPNYRWNWKRIITYAIPKSLSARL